LLNKGETNLLDEASLKEASLQTYRYIGKIERKLTDRTATLLF
jgi:hypothetical protein